MNKEHIKQNRYKEIKGQIRKYKGNTRLESTFVNDRELIEKTKSRTLG